MVMRCLSDIRDNNNMECLKSREDEMSPFHFFDGVLVIGAFHGDTASPPSKNPQRTKIAWTASPAPASRRFRNFVSSEQLVLFSGVMGGMEYNTTYLSYDKVRRYVLEA